VPEGSRSAEVQQKIDDIRGWLEDASLAGVVLGSQSNFAWITGGGRSHVSIGAEAGVASVVVTRDAAVLITTNIELARLLDEEVSGLPFEALEYPWQQQQEGSAQIAARFCQPAKCAADLPSDDLSPIDGSFLELRRILRPPEVARYRDLGRDAAACVGIACRMAEPGDTEHYIAARLARECEKRDILALVNLVAADERIARYRHPLPTTNRLRGTLLVALTGRRHGLHASATRMVSFGMPDDELVSRHRAVTQVDARAILESSPGTTLGEVMAREIDHYEREGFPEEWRLHHQGGLTGYAGREVFAVPGSPYKLKSNQAVAWNPSITRVKSEDTVLITEDGPEILTRDPEWPEQPVEISGGALPRPSLLVRGES
jgi:Xaa-Pro aminopeptidase